MTEKEMKAKTLLFDAIEKSALYSCVEKTKKVIEESFKGSEELEV